MPRAFKLFATQIEKHFSKDSNLALIQEIDIRDMEIRMFSKNFMRTSLILLHTYSI